MDRSLKLKPSLFALALCFATGCLGEAKPIEDCVRNDGDAFCTRRNPSRPYCVAASDPCFDASNLAHDDPLGCVAEMPAAECRNICGNGNDCTDPTTDPSSSSTSDETDSSTTEDPTMDTESSSSSSTGPECMDDVECIDPGMPFCIDDVCQGCSAAADMADERCSMLDETTPFCVDDACVQCTADDGTQCGATSPLCDLETNACIPCSWHEQCEAIGSPACNFNDGSCFDPNTAIEVNGGIAGTVQGAIDMVQDGGVRAIIVTGGGQLHTMTIDAGKTIAIVANSQQELRGNSGNPTLTVSGEGTTAILHRVNLTANTDDVGISVENTATLYADKTRISQNSGGGVTLASGTTATLRNSMVSGAAGNPGLAAIDATEADLDVVYSTLGLGFNNGGSVLECSGGDVTIRNTIVVNEAATAGAEIDCTGAVVADSTEETTLSPTDWFPGFANGDYALNPAGATQFMNIATWRDGDPLVDFDGDLRPNQEGAQDYAGADVP